jgi:hypothetical protein
MENQAILKRLQDKQPNYNVQRWEEEAMNRTKILNNICEYPYLLHYPTNKDEISSSDLSNQQTKSQ